MRFAPHEIADLRKSADDAIAGGDVDEGNKLHLLLDEHEAVNTMMYELEVDSLDQLLEKTKNASDVQDRYESLKDAVAEAKEALDGIDVS